MADIDIPAHLITARRTFEAAEKELADLAASLPKAIDIATGQAELTDDDRRRFNDAKEQALTAAVEIQLDPWWASVDDRAKARIALLEAAKS